MIEPKDIFFAKKLRNLRIRSNKIQYEVAVELGLRDQRVLSEFESGKRHFSDELILKICSFFHVREDEFRSHHKRANSNKQNSQSVVIDQKLGSSAKVDEQIRILLFRKENVELQIEKIRLECKLQEAQCKLKALNSHPGPGTIFVLI